MLRAAPGWPCSLGLFWAALLCVLKMKALVFVHCLLVCNRCHSTAKGSPGEYIIPTRSDDTDPKYVYFATWSNHLISGTWHLYQMREGSIHLLIISSYSLAMGILKGKSSNIQNKENEPNIYTLLEFFIQHNSSAHFIIDECPFLSSKGK